MVIWLANYLGSAMDKFTVSELKIERKQVENLEILLGELRVIEAD